MQKSNRRKNISTIIILAIVLLVPGFLYVALNRVGTNAYVKLPIYGEKTLSGKMVRKMGREKPDTIYHQVKPLILQDIDGKPVDFLGADSTISVVHMFYAADSGLSVAMLQSLAPVVERFVKNDKVQFYSISIDPKDDIAALKAKTKNVRKGLEHNWNILHSTGDFSDYARSQLLSDAVRDNLDSTRYIMSPQYLLLDSKRRIRGFYDVSMKKEVDRLKDEIKVQLVEEARDNPSKIEKK